MLIMCLSCYLYYVVGSRTRDVRPKWQSRQSNINHKIHNNSLASFFSLQELLLEIKQMLRCVINLLENRSIAGPTVKREDEGYMVNIKYK